MALKKKKVTKKVLKKKVAKKSSVDLYTEFDVCAGVSRDILDFLSEVNDHANNPDVDDVFFRKFVERAFSTLKVRMAKSIALEKGSDVILKSFGYRKFVDGWLAPEWIAGYPKKVPSDKSIV
jgi:hypothetical protein